MTRRVVLGCLIATAALAGCVAKHAMPSMPPAYRELDKYADGDGESSLFKGDSEVLSDEDIARILSVDLKLPANSRVAVLKLGGARYWSEDHARIEESNTAAFLKRLEEAEAISHAAELPKLLVPVKRTVPYLREAAARYQADLLVVYDSSVRTFSKYRALGKDEVRALCSVEAVLIDVRTGIVPFTGHRTEELLVSKAADDLDFSETTAKAVSTAEGKALVAIADEIVGYLQASR